MILVAVILSTVRSSALGADDESSLYGEEIESSVIDVPGDPEGIDPEEYFAFSFFGRRFLLAAELQFCSEYMKDYELESRAADGLSEIEPALNVAFFYELGEKTFIYLENEVQHKTHRYIEAGGTSDQWVFERIESWILFRNIAGSGVSLQMGRQSYEDERQWWWDEQLDSIRVHFDRSRFHTEIAVAREVAAASTEVEDRDPENQHIFRILSQTVWGGSEALHYALFALYQDDRSRRRRESDPYITVDDTSDADLFWYGVRAAGELETENLGNFSWWVDMAGVSGDETLYEFEADDEDAGDEIEIITRDVSGRGGDTGIVWETGALGDMMLTFGYAWGSGDRNPEDGKNRSFRQSGFNEGDMRFQYYGELLNPDLSNLHILTVAVGFPVNTAGFFDVIYHRYRQDHPADFLWESDLEIDPEGRRSFIGEEWDVAFTFEGASHVEIESSAALFKAGDAFGNLSGETAYRLKFEVNYLF